MLHIVFVFNGGDETLQLEVLVIFVIEEDVAGR